MEGQKMDGVWKDGEKLVEFIRFLLCFHFAHCGKDFTLCIADNNIMIITWLLAGIYNCVPRSIIWFATLLRSGANDATRYALQKSCDCPIIILIPVNNNFNKNFHSRKVSGRALLVTFFFSNIKFIVLWVARHPSLIGYCQHSNERW